MALEVRQVGCCSLGKGNSLNTLIMSNVGQARGGEKKKGGQVKDK